MTIPYERTRAILETRKFLQGLTYPPATPRVPKAVREMARQLLRHYPSNGDVAFAHTALTQWFGPVPPFSRLTGNPQTQGVIDATLQSELGDKNDGRRTD